MAIRPISFGKEFKTREVVNIVSGKEIASTDFIMGISGLTYSDLLTKNSSDMYVASSSYCGKEIARKNPILQPLRDISEVLHDEISKLRPNDEKMLYKVKGLFSQRDAKCDEICSQLGETIDIEPFDIPFLK